MKYLWMYRLTDDRSCATVEEVYLTIPMAETHAVREVRTDLGMSKWNDRVMSGSLYRIDETVGLPASKPTRTFKRDAKGKVTAVKPHVPFGERAEPGDGMSKVIIGIYKLIPLKVHGGRVLVTSNVTGSVLGTVYVDGTVDDKGRLPEAIIQAAKDLAAKELGS